MPQPKRNANKGKKDPDRVLFDAGVKEGRRQMQVVILTYLEQRYLDKEIVRTGYKAKAILSLAADLAEYIRGLNAVVKSGKLDLKVSDGQ